MASKKKTTRPKNTLPNDPVTFYAQQVVAGKIVAGPHVRNACARHLRDLKDGHKRGLMWDVAAANRAINFFPDVLRLAGGQYEGLPFQLHISQQFKTGSLFGWKRKDGKRRFRRAYIEEGKGNGKSPWAAGIGIYGCVADNEPRAEVYAAARSKDQSYVLFRDAVAMVDQSPALAARFVKSGTNPVWNLADFKTGSFFRPLSAEGAHSGPRPHFALCDEIHEHPNGTILEMLERGFKWRQQPLLVMITNSGSDRNSVCWAEHEHAIKVASGEIENDEMFSYVCALDEAVLNAQGKEIKPADDPLTDPTCWPKANPLLDVTIKRDYLAGVVAQAKAIPGKLNGILRLHFCVWTDADQAWMPRATLEPRFQEKFDPADYAGDELYVGLDLSGSQDLTAAGFAVETGKVERVREIEGKKTKVLLPTFDVWVEAWTPEDTLAARALKDKAPYDVWVRDGFLHATPGKNIRMDFVAARIAEFASEYRIKMLAYDRYAYRKFEDELDSQGVTIPCSEHPQGGRRRAKVPDDVLVAAKNRGLEPPQGLWMPGSLLELETLILEERIRFLRNPVLISAFMSVAIESDPFDNRWFSKRKATQRIDAAVAVAMAVGAATQNLAPVETESIYEKPGFFI